MADKSEAPGLKWRPRANGERQPYWCARPNLVRAGYQPKTVRLNYDLTDPDRDANLAHRCRVLQAEMLEWAGSDFRKDVFDGTLRSLVHIYETHPESPYQDLRPTTKRSYTAHLKVLLAAVGDRRLDAVTGEDVKRWYKNIAAPKAPGEPGHVGYAYLIVGILKAVISYGASRGRNLCVPNPCITLRGELSGAKFKNAPPRRNRLTYEQVKAFRKAAHALNFPSMALGITLQFECSLRQRDVIGEWIDRRWEGGLTWNHIGSDGVLRKRTTKTGAEVAHRIADYPDLAAELERVPAERRVGPLVICEPGEDLYFSKGAGLPYSGSSYRHRFRLIARAAGIPDDIWSMDARAGAVTEAYEAGAKTEGAMALAGHTKASTSRRYLRDMAEQSSTVARLRVESRKHEKD